MATIDSPDLTGRFFNRELSWLAFNRRVLEEATCPQNRLLERAKFAAIVASNLDEFFMVRVAALKHAVAEGDVTPGPCGLSPEAQLEAIADEAHRMMDDLYACVEDDLRPALQAHGFWLASIDRLDESARAGLLAYFHDEVLPALTPLAIDVERPFPMLASLTLNLAFFLAPAAGTAERRLAVVQVPGGLSRLVRVSADDGLTFVLLEDVIRHAATVIFPGQTVLECAAFRLSRDSELALDDDSGSYVEALQEELRRRRRSSVVRLEVEAAMSAALLETLRQQVHVGAADVYRIQGFLDIRVLTALADLPRASGLCDPPRLAAGPLDAEQLDDIFSVLDRQDVLLHHPHDSFDAVVRFVEAAAEDPDVLAIKQTLYRTSGDSPIVQALTRAADHGKQVTVVVELRARFDEERNIRWAQRLEETGAHVIYGVRDYKVHAKVCLVVRRTSRGVKRYLHLGTGNYNDRTARIYSDMGLLTSSPALGADASAFFSMLTGYSDPPRLHKLSAAPHTLRERLLKLIEREARRARAGQPAAIRAKMNALTDVGIIEALYAASQAGVRTALNVRGVCALRPGVPGLSEHITVTSVVGRYLEHARVVIFHNGGEEEVYLSSADWMTRNLDRRVELMFPIEDPDAAAKVSHALSALLRDTAKGRVLDADGRWALPVVPDTNGRFDSQSYLDERAHRAQPRLDKTHLEPLARPEQR